MAVKIINTKFGENISPAFTGCVVWRCGDREWMKDDQFHNESGPAVIRRATCTFEFWLDGEEKKEEVIELFYMLKYRKPWSSTWWRRRNR